MILKLNLLKETMKRNLLYVAAAGACGLFATATANAQETVMIEEESVSVVDAANCKTHYSVDKGDNWFIQLGVGIDVPLFENQLAGGKDPKRHITATYNLGVGRWFSPYLGFRLSAYYGAWHWDNVSYSKARMANLNLDFMWDMCNSLGGVNASRPVSVIPFVGLGGTYVWDIKSEGRNIMRKDGGTRSREWLLLVSAGLQFRFRLCRYVDFFLEGRASFYGDNANGSAYDKSIDINIQATGGFSFNLGGANYQAYNECKDLAYINSLNNQVNGLRGELAATAAALAAAQAQLPCPEVQPVPVPEAIVYAPMMSTVRFKINSANISDEEMVNVYNTAEYLKANPEVNVVIKGYADKDTGTAEYNMELSGRRAKAVYDALTKTYGINANRLSIDAKGSDSQPYDTNNWNRIVIFVPGN